MVYLVGDSFGRKQCRSCEASYDLEHKSSLAAFLEDANIRLVRAECSSYRSARYSHPVHMLELRLRYLYKIRMSKRCLQRR